MVLLKPSMTDVSLVMFCFNLRKLKLAVRFVCLYIFRF